MTAGKKLNLGCGQFAKPGYVNVDVDINSQADVIHDLSQFPYPFKDAEFDLIEVDHVLEHLPDAFAAMKEIARITGPGAIIDVRVPHFSRGFTHAQHKAGFDFSFPLYFQRDWPGGFCGCELVSVRTRLTWFAQPHLKKKVLGPIGLFLGMVIGALLDAVANLSPAFCSRIWCYWFGGFEEIRFVFRKPAGRDEQGT